VDPEIVVLPRRDAAQAILGRNFKLTESRGRIVPSDLALRDYALATVPPSFVLRQRTGEGSAAASWPASRAILAVRRARARRLPRARARELAEEARRRTR
jgi:hypothetical protein